MSAIDTLVLHARYSTRLSYYDDWLEAFERSRRFDVTTANICDGGAGAVIRARLGTAELIVLLHSTNSDTLMYLAPLKELLKARRGKLLVFVGNELNLPGSPMAEKIAYVRDVEADFIATQMLAEAGRWLYASCPKAQVVSVPHGLNPSAFQAEAPLEARAIDIGTRSARYIPYLGDDERNRLFAAFDRLGQSEPGLRIDINTKQRLDRTAWAAYLNQCKGTLANEAGTWYLEPDDHTTNEIRAWVREREGGIVIANDSPLRRLSHALPWFVKAGLRPLLRAGPLRHEALVNEQVPFAEVYVRFFKDRLRAPVYTKVVSSRHFDAIGTKTCQILVRGRYNDTLVAGEHYLALEPDFSNLDAVVAEFRDPDRRGEIAEAALAHALAGHTLDHRLEALHAAVQSG